MVSTVYMVDTIDMVYTVDMVYAVDMVYTVDMKEMRGMMGAIMGKTGLRAETPFGK